MQHERAAACLSTTRTADCCGEWLQLDEQEGTEPTRGSLMLITIPCGVSGTGGGRMYDIVRNTLAHNDDAAQHCVVLHHATTNV